MTLAVVTKPQAEAKEKSIGDLTTYCALLKYNRVVFPLGKLLVRY